MPKRTKTDPEPSTPEQLEALRRLDDVFTLVVSCMGRRAPLRRVSVLHAVAGCPGASFAEIVEHVRENKSSIRRDLADLGQTTWSGEPGQGLITHKWEVDGENRTRFGFYTTPAGDALVERIMRAFAPL
jgi:hypothetical protein